MAINIGPLKPFPPNFDFNRYGKLVELHDFFGRNAKEHEWMVDDPDIVFTPIGPIRSFPADYQLPK